MNKSKFDELQKMIIQIGLRKKLDVSVYSNPEFHWTQMNLISCGLEKGLNVSLYAKTCFCI